MTNTETAFLFPLLPGKRQALSQFVEALTHEWRAEHDRNHHSILHESWFLQTTALGDIVIVYMVTTDPYEVFVDLAISQEPFQVWFRANVLELTGMNLAMVPPFSMPQNIFHRTR